GMRRRVTAPPWAPMPPVPMPPGRVITVPDRGEVFFRDSGGEGPPVLLLHGWMFSADLNWFTMYEPLIGAGYRVLALDHRGHGRGIRAPQPFRLTDCADDAAGVLRELGVSPVLATGYSMGGPIACLLARRHPELVRGLVLCATSTHWRSRRMRRFWRAMALIRLILGAFPNAAWRRGLRAAGFPDSPITTWTASELTRGSARDLAEAGRELSRYDGRPWLGELPHPAAVVVTTGDGAVPPKLQRGLAETLGAPTFDAPGDHGAVIARRREFEPALFAALRSVMEAAPRTA
ncbi:MAG: hydrolase, partial [Solirubrobacterales bacterium]|nr:hydrolase [Solirubrobacterales bacterium]